MKRLFIQTGKHAAAIVVALTLTGAVSAQAPKPSGPTSVAELPLFAIEITVGSRWDPAKRPQDQPHFREHSAHLKRLRDAGHLVAGARYANKGLVVLAAESEATARAMMEEDPSIKADIFKYEAHPFNVFYAGTLNLPPRKAAQP